MTTEELAAQAAEVVQKSVQGLKTELTPQIDMLTQKNAELSSKNTELETAIRDLGVKFEAQKSAQTIDNSRNFLEAIQKAATILKNDRSGMHQVVPVEAQKAVGTLTTANITGTTQAVIPPAIDPTRIDYAKPTFSLLTSANVVSTPSPLVWWSERNAGEGAAGMTGEGLAKSQIDFDYVGKSASVKKITAFIKVSTEMLDDVQGIESDINNELLYQLALKLNEQLLTGDNLGQNLIGITTVARPLEDTTIQDKVTAPQFYDCLVAAINQIINNFYIPNEIRLHPTDATLMKLTKDKNENYLMPPFVSASGQIVDNIRVIQDPTMTAGNFLVGDFSKFNVRPYGNTGIEMGFVNDDFTKNLVTIRAEMRVTDYVKEHHKKAFVYESFADAKTFIDIAV